MKTQFCAHADQRSQLEFFLLGHHRRTQRDKCVTVRRDLAFVDALLDQPLAENIDNQSARLLEVVHLVGVTRLARRRLFRRFAGGRSRVRRHQLQHELNAAGQIKAKTDRTPGFLANRANGIAVVFQLTLLHQVGQIDALLIGGLKQCRGVKLLLAVGLKLFRPVHYPNHFRRTGVLYHF